MFDSDAVEDPANDPRTLDRDVILFAAGVWAAELLQWFLRSLSNETLGGPKEILEKVLYNTVAFGLTAGIWGILRSRGPFSGWRFIRVSSPLILLASALNTVLAWAIYYMYTPVAEPLFPLTFEWIRLAPQPLSYLWVFLTWACLVATLVGSAEMRTRERALAESEYQVQQARLHALRYQIHPHLVFNSLNAILALMGKGDQVSARRALELLSDYLRNALASSSASLVTLDREFGMQKLYLDIEAIRFADRLRIVFSVDPDARAALVPSIILQPLVENAVKHGLALSIEGATIEIGARRMGDRLSLWVQDDGMSASDRIPEGFGIGLGNVRSRLQTHYGDDASLTAGPSGGGWRSEIVMPFEVEVSAAND
ncbi:two-component sensor histidine kinase [Brevundimonas alba]|uniref:Two-component sensor histidine kinase n=1 Tax=Brevundimonas alba TaxID=74314 RepID=A0A7X6BPP6_9CAUL|nr:histidine kinase [Brevundimonas alba]NJC41706.1 two-component sensor histidine kinase [Brevundimonas alba]